MKDIDRSGLLGPPPLLDRPDLSLPDAPLLPPGLSQLPVGGSGEVLEFIEQCRHAASPEMIFELFRAAAERLGYDRIALVPVTPQAGSRRQRSAKLDQPLLRQRLRSV